MGLYDTIIDELFCPFCGIKLGSYDFQTKDLGQNMSHWTIAEIKKVKKFSREDDTHIYTTCKNCSKWIQLVIRGECRNDDFEFTKFLIETKHLRNRRLYDKRNQNNKKDDLR